MNLAKRAAKRILSVLLVAAIACSTMIMFASCAGKELQEIEITTQPTKTTYIQGESFDPAGMVVSAVYEGDEKKTLDSNDYTFEPSGALKTSDRYVTVSYTEGETTETARVSIKVTNEVTAATIKTPATKLGYVKGEKFDPAGMVLSLTYQDGSTKDVAFADSGATVPQTALAGTEKNVTVTIGDVTVTQAIEFAKGVTIKTAPDKTTYMLGEKFDPAGMVLSLTFPTLPSIDVAVKGSIATYKTGALTENDTSIEITYGDFKVTQPITLAKGVFIEAEDGILPEGAKITDDGEDLDPEDTAHYPSGGLYVGDFKADDSKDPEDMAMVFQFASDSAGTGDISFRLASQYLKQDSNWTPIWMGDCQFNKLCDLYVNGVQYPIADTVVLKGGGEENGEPDPTLWRLWQNVDFTDIDFVEGKNEIELRFKEHDYGDCSQSSFNNKFTANIDSLIVTSAECTISPYAITSYNPSEVYLETANESGKTVPYFVIEGTFNYSGYQEEELAAALNAKMSFDFQGDLASSSSSTRFLNEADDRVVTVEAGTNGQGTFTMKVNVESLSKETTAKYSTHFGAGLGNLDMYNPETLLQPEDVKTGADNAVETAHHTYTLVYEPEYSGSNPSPDAPGTTSEIRKEHYYGCVGLMIESDGATYSATAETAKLEVVGDKVYYVINGTYTVEKYSDDELKEALMGHYFDLQRNANIGGGNSWTSYYPEAVEVTLGADGTYTVKYDVTDLPDNPYTSHYGTKSDGGAADFKPADNYEQTVSCGGRTYTMTVVAGSSQGTEFWGCVGLTIATPAAA